MKCEECLLMIDELVEGELDRGLAEEMTTHLTVCTVCARRHESLRWEQELYSQYLLDVEATPALWANLRMGIEKEKVVRASDPLFRLQRWLGIALGSIHVSPLQAAALVLVTIGLAIGIMQYRSSADVSRKTVASRNANVDSSQLLPEVAIGTRPSSNRYDSQAADDSQTEVGSPSTEAGKRNAPRVETRRPRPRLITAKSEILAGSPTVEQITRNTEQQYVAAIVILSRDVARRRALIAPAAVSQLEKALVEVDQIINATRRAVRETPTDPVAIQYMTTAYQKKVELLRATVTR